MPVTLLRLLSSCESSPHLFVPSMSFSCLSFWSVHPPVTSTPFVLLCFLLRAVFFRPESSSILCVVFSAGVGLSQSDHVRGTFVFWPPRLPWKAGRILSIVLPEVTHLCSAAALNIWSSILGSLSVMCLNVVFLCLT